MGALDDLYNKIVQPAPPSTPTAVKAPAPSTGGALDRLLQKVTTKPTPQPPNPEIQKAFLNLPSVNRTTSNTTPSSILNVQSKQPKKPLDINFFVQQTLPKAAVGTARSLMRGGLALGKTISELGPQGRVAQPAYSTEGASRLEKAVAKTLVGDEPIPNLTEYGKEFLPKAAEKGPLPFLAGTILAGLDFTGLGGEKNAVKALVKATKADDVIKLLKKANVSEDLAKIYAPKLVAETNPEVVGNLLKNINQAQHTPLPPQDSVSKVIRALKEAEPIRGQQEQLYSIARGQKLGKGLEAESKTIASQGYEAGFKAKIKSLAGELPKVQFESLRKNIDQTDVDNLFKAIKENTTISEWEKLPAGTGLAKIFDGGLPTEGELRLLNKVFPKEFIDEVIAKRPMLQKLRDAGLEIANIPKTLMASADLSAPLRQGLFLSARNPKEFGKAFGQMFKYFGSERAFQESAREIATRPTFGLMQKAKLALTNMDAALGLREEQFLSTWAEKIPIVGKVVRASGRAYTGFLNKLRADVFDKMIKGAQAAGRDVVQEEKLLQDIGRFVNTFSGRGNIEAAEPLFKALNGLFFSPRLIMSRLTILNPAYYIKADPFVRKEALKTLFTTVGAGMTALGLAKMAGAGVGVDPRSSDFGKIKIGNTRIDLWGGEQQYVRMLGQLFSGKYISSTTGKEYTLGEGYKPITRWDILQRQVESKLAPIPSFIVNVLRQQDYAGQKVNIPKEIAERFVPIIATDIYDIMKDDPKLLPLTIPAAFGAGVQTYAPLPEVKKKTSTTSRKSSRGSTRSRSR